MAGVMKPDCRKFLRENRFLGLIDPFIEKEVLSLADLKDFCDIKKPAKAIEELGTDPDTAARLVELVKRNGPKWPKNPKKSVNLDEKIPLVPPAVIATLDRDFVNYLKENNLEEYKDGFAAINIGTMTDLKKLCAKQLALEELNKVGMKRVQARTLVSNMTKVEAIDAMLKKKDNAIMSALAQPKMTKEQEEAAKAKAAKQAKLAAEKEEKEKWYKKVHERVAEKNRYTGVIETVTGVGFFGRDIRRPRYALYDKSSGSLELYMEQGALAETFSVEKGTGVDGGAAGPLRRRFNLQMIAAKGKEKPIMHVFHTYTQKESADWADAINGVKPGAKKPKKVVSPTSAKDVKKQETTPKKVGQSDEEGGKKGQSPTPSVSELAQRAEERKQAMLQRRESKNLEGDKSVSSPIKNSKKLSSSSITSPRAGSGRESAEFKFSKDEKSEIKDLQAKKSAGTLTAAEKKRLKQLKEMKKSSSMFEGDVEKEEEEQSATATVEKAETSDDVAGAEPEPEPEDAVVEEYKPQFSVGERMFALYKDDGNWYAARITAVHLGEMEGEETYDIDYEGFSDEDKVDLGLTVEEVAPASDFEEAEVEAAAEDQVEAEVAEEEEEEAVEAEPEVEEVPSGSNGLEAVEEDKELEVETLPTPQLQEKVEEADNIATDNATSPAFQKPPLSPQESKKLEKAELKRQQSELKEKEKQAKLEAIEKAKQEKLEAIERAKAEKERAKQEKLEAIERAKQEKLDALARAKEEKMQQKQMKLEAIEREKQAKLEAIERAKQAKEAEKQAKLAAIQAKS